MVAPAFFFIVFVVVHNKYHLHIIAPMAKSKKSAAAKQQGGSPDSAPKTPSNGAFWLVIRSSHAAPQLPFLRD